MDVPPEPDHREADSNGPPAGWAARSKNRARGNNTQGLQSRREPAVASAGDLQHHVRRYVSKGFSHAVRDITAAQHDARLLPPDVLDANAEQTRLLKAIEPVMNGVITQVMEAVRGHAHEHNLRFERQQTIAKQRLQENQAAAALARSRNTARLEAVRHASTRAESQRVAVQGHELRELHDESVERVSEEATKRITELEEELVQAKLSMAEEVSSIRQEYARRTLLQVQATVHALPFQYNVTLAEAGSRLTQ